MQTVLPKLKDCLTFFQQNYLTLKPGPSAVSSAVIRPGMSLNTNTTISSSSTPAPSTPSGPPALIEQHEINRLGSLNFFGDIQSFLNTKSLQDVLCNTGVGGLATPAVAGQICYVVDILLLMLKKSKYVRRRRREGEGAEQRAGRRRKDLGLF